MAQPARNEDPSLIPPPRVMDATDPLRPKLMPTTNTRGPGVTYPSAGARLTDSYGRSMSSDPLPPLPQPAPGTGNTVPLAPQNPLQGSAVPALKAGIDNLHDGYDLTESVARTTQDRVQRQNSTAGKAGAATLGALKTPFALAADQGIGAAKGAYAVATPVLKVAETVGGAAMDFVGGMFAGDEPAKPTPAAPAPAAAAPAPAAAPAKPAPVKAPSLTGTGPMSGSIASATPTAAPAPSGNLYDAGMKYAEDLRRINQRLIDTGTVMGGPMPAMAPPSAPAAPFKPSVQSPFAGSTNKWDKMWNAQWNAAALKNAQQVGVQQQNAGINAFNADTQRKQVDQMPVLEAGRQAAAQKVAETSASASMYGSDAQLAGVAMTNANRTAIEAAKLAQRQLEMKGSEGPPTAIALTDGIVTVGKGGVTAYQSLDMLKADGQVRAAVRAAAVGDVIKDASGAAIGTKVMQGGKPGIRLDNGNVIPIETPVGKTSTGTTVPSLTGNGDY